MTQVEFEQKIKEMKQQKAAELQPLQVMNNDIRERQTSKMQLLREMQEQYLQLERERKVIAKRMTAIIDEHNARIRKFANDNYVVTRQLENISIWALVKELKKRGYIGNLRNASENDEHIERLNAILNTHMDEGEGGTSWEDLKVTD